ncbi:hypothetical protein [Allisonella histaminiformans]|uniref:hypothetical protein n=1 Tax=Allisonella histaminiformans TaxID=209880 RepID=UPI0035228407
MTKLPLPDSLFWGILNSQKKTAAALAAKAPADTEVIMTAETKGIPLAESMGPSYGASLLCSGQKIN